MYNITISWRGIVGSLIRITVVVLLILAAYRIGWIKGHYIPECEVIHTYHRASQEI